jgi:Glycosyl hydrolase family 26
MRAGGGPVESVAMPRPRLCLALVLASVASALALAAAPAASAASITPRSGVYLGAFANEPGGIAALESAVGRRLAIDRTYVPWTFTGWAKRIAPDAAAGRMPELAWSAAPATTAAAIAAGTQDRVIRAAAKAIKATGVDVMLVPWYEFDQPAGHKRYIGTPRRVRIAWRRMVDLFRAAGAANVHFVWTPMAYDFGPHAGVDAAGFYPGDRYVHWIGADAYNFPTAPFRTQAGLLNAAVGFAAAHRKPFIVGETASLGAAAPTPAWIAAFGSWAALHPQVRAITYFDSISPKGYDFRLIANPSALSAFAALGAEPDMTAMPPA